MPTILESLYYGKLVSQETPPSQDPHYSQLSRQISASVDVWRGKLPADDFAELEALLDLYQQRHGMEMAASFSQGFRMGAEIVFEVYAERLNSKWSG